MMSVPSEESYVLKRVLRGFRSLRSLILWRVCDDAMLQILGVTCHHLESIGGRGGVLVGCHCIVCSYRYLEIHQRDGCRCEDVSRA